jgi:hypothetical protein
MHGHRNNSIIVIGSPRLYVSPLLHYSPQTVEWKKQSLLWLAEGVLDTIYYGPNAVKLCWFGGNTAAKLCTQRLQYEIMDDK